jgi:nodulation protein E
MRRVVITGAGCISALGANMSEMWDALAAGRSGIGPNIQPELDVLQIRINAAVKDFDPEAHFDAKQLPILDRFTQFALVAAREAVAQSGLEFDDALAARTAVITGTGSGGMSTIDVAYKRLYEDRKLRIFPLTVPRLMVSAATSHVTMAFGIRGPAYTVSSACSSANHAIGEAFNMIRYGRVDAAIAGGSEASLTLGALCSWQSLRVMATDTCRPFCIDRKGMVLGEGAGMFVLETLEAAKARGADILAEIVGFGMTSDAGDIVQPSLDGVCGAIAGALEDGALAPEAIDYVNAHGTGTDINDIVETAALHQVLGEHAKSIAVSSTKSMHGHALGAAGALELAATLSAITHQTAPPTANFTKPDPQCDLDYVPNAARQMKIDAALSNSFAFGGLNAVLALKRMA